MARRLLTRSPNINAKQAEAEGESDIKKLQKEVSWHLGQERSEEHPSWPMPNMTAGGKAANPNLAEQAHE